MEEPGLLVQAKFADLLGLKETYNVPGTVSEENWSLRIPQEYRREYGEKLGRDAALNLPGALAMALRAVGPEHQPLIENLERLAAGMRHG